MSSTTIYFLLQLWRAVRRKRLLSNKWIYCHQRQFILDYCDCTRIGYLLCSLYLYIYLRMPSSWRTCTCIGEYPSLMASPLIVQWSLLVLAIGPALIFSLFVSLLLFSYAKDAIVISSKLWRFILLHYELHGRDDLRDTVS